MHFKTKSASYVASSDLGFFRNSGAFAFEGETESHERDFAWVEVAKRGDGVAQR